MSAPEPARCLDDNAIAAVAAGQGETDDRARWLAHTDSCDRCQQVVAAVIRARRGTAAATAPTGPDAQPSALALGSAEAAIGHLGSHDRSTETTIGRYRITGVLGAGGMGVVYEARDPELDRLLAIKLLRDGAGEAERGLTARLIREARAMAQLAHPNVVAIHDVGEHAGRPFLAMEYIRGTTLRTWSSDAPRTWREIAGVFAQAARGLAAAHAANLVHRDFKPDNVMVGSDGRVRVTDFGLVRPAGCADDAVADRSPDGVGDPAILTQTGALLGTPAYMSPEQHLGEPGTARSDQFNFMVALYEAIHGVRPFTGDSWAELRAAVLAGVPRPQPAGARVPRWLRRLIERGLARDPAARHDSMTYVASMLARGVTRRRSIALLAPVAGVALVAAIAASVVIGKDDRAVCSGGDEHISRIWNPGVKARVQAAFLAIGEPFAADAFRAVDGALDDYGARWADAHRATCEATEVLHEQSAELLDQRMACLATRREEMRAFVGLLEAADRALVERAAQTASTLSGLDECANVEALGRTRARITIRERVGELELVLARARASSRAGRYQEAIALARPALEAATALGHRPLEAEALFVVAGIDEDLGRFGDAERLYRDTIRAAEAGGHDTLKASAWASLIDVVGERLARPKEALELEHQARAVIERVNDAKLRADLDVTTARALQRSGDYAAARSRHQAAIAALVRLRGERHLDVATALDGLVAVHMATGDYKDALAAAERALAIRARELGRAHPVIAKSLQNVANGQYLVGDTTSALATMRDALALGRSVYGPDHPELALIRTNLGAILERAGRYDEALRELEAALAARRTSLGPKHADVATSLLALGNVHNARGAFDKAEALYRECLAIREEVLGPEHADIELALGNLGAVLAAKGAHDAAEALHRRALAIAEKTRGADHPGVNIHLANLARLAAARGKHAEAVPLYLRALASDEKHLGANHPQLGRHLSSLAAVYLELHRAREAVPLLERAIKLWATGAIDPTQLAEARILLAEALTDSGGDRARAHEQAALALAELERSPVQNAEWIGYIKDWQRKTPRK